MRPNRAVEPSGPAVVLVMYSTSSPRTSPGIGSGRYVRQE